MSRKRRSPFSLFAFQDIITSVMGIMILVTLLLALELVERTQSAPAAQTQQSLDRLQTYYRQLRRQVEQLQEQIEQQAERHREIHDRRYLVIQIQNVKERLRMLQRETTALMRRLRQAENAYRRLQQQAAQKREEQRRRQEALAQQIQALQRRMQQMQNQVFFKPAEDFHKTAWVVEVRGPDVRVFLLGDRASPVRFADATAFLQWVSRLRDPAEDYFLLVFKPGGAGDYDELMTSLRGSGYEIGLELLPAEKQVFSRPASKGPQP